MALENSILKSVKHALGLADGYDVFDPDVLLHINAAFNTLTDLGVGPTAGFMIVDDTAMWDSFVTDDNRVNAVRQYVYMKVRMAFDPPQSQYMMAALGDQIREAEWRISVRREATDYVSPFPAPTLLEDDVVVDGGEV